MKKEQIKKQMNQSIGSMLSKDKYKFLPHGLVGEICRDFVEEYNNEEAEEEEEDEEEDEEEEEEDEEDEEEEKEVNPLGELF